MYNVVSGLDSGSTGLGLRGIAFCSWAKRFNLEVLLSPPRCINLGTGNSMLEVIEGLNGVNRQPSNGQKINGQPSNERAKISRQISHISLKDQYRLT